MNENGISWRPTRAAMALPILSGLVGLLVLGGGRAEGAAAKRFALSAPEARVFQVWSNYLAKGPDTWSARPAPAFTPAIRSTIWQVMRTDTQAQSLNNPMIDYLLWRQSINPTRFTANHPRLSPALAQLLNAPQFPTSVPPPTSPPASQTTVPQGITPPAPLTPPSTQSVSPQAVSPPPVPEPGSLILAAGMLGWGLWWRRRIQPSRAR